MDDILMYSTDEIIYKRRNEIKFFNFILQGKKHQLLSLIPGCSESNINNVYLALYDYLVKKGIIKSKFKVLSLWTADYFYKINPQFIEVSSLKDKIKKENVDYPELLKCYEVNYSNLSHFLKTYKYAVTDQVEIAKVFVKKGGKTRKKYRRNVKSKKKLYLK